jgi:hypothetical protein
MTEKINHLQNYFSEEDYYYLSWYIYNAKSEVKTYYENNSMIVLLDNIYNITENKLIMITDTLLEQNTFVKSVTIFGDIEIIYLTVNPNMRSYIKNVINKVHYGSYDNDFYLNRDTTLKIIKLI